MIAPMKILGTNWKDAQHIMVEYSNDTTVTYTIEQLMSLKPESIQAFEEPKCNLPN